eukprot:scaffold50346_cov55-Phaeocystis_antarctica.AAC.5
MFIVIYRDAPPRCAMTRVRATSLPCPHHHHSHHRRPRRQATSSLRRHGRGGGRRAARAHACRLRLGREGRGGGSGARCAGARGDVRGDGRRSRRRHGGARGGVRLLREDDLVNSEADRVLEVDKELVVGGDVPHPEALLGRPARRLLEQRLGHVDVVEEAERDAHAILIGAHYAACQDGANVRPKDDEAELHGRVVRPAAWMQVRLANVQDVVQGDAQAEVAHHLVRVLCVQCVPHRSEGVFAELVRLYVHGVVHTGQLEHRAGASSCCSEQPALKLRRAAPAQTVRSRAGQGW